MHLVHSSVSMHLALPLQCAHVWSLVKHHFRPNFSWWKTFAWNFTGAVNLQWASTLCKQLRTCLMLFSALHDLPNRVYIGMQELLLLQKWRVFPCVWWTLFIFHFCTPFVNNLYSIKLLKKLVSCKLLNKFLQICNLLQRRNVATLLK